MTPSGIAAPAAGSCCTTVPAVPVSDTLLVTLRVKPPLVAAACAWSSVCPVSNGAAGGRSRTLNRTAPSATTATTAASTRKVGRRRRLCTRRRCRMASVRRVVPRGSSLSRSRSPGAGAPSTPRCRLPGGRGAAVPGGGPHTPLRADISLRPVPARRRLSSRPVRWRSSVCRSSPTSAPSRSSADWKRFSGSFSRQRSTTRSSPSGRSSRSSRSGRGCSRTCNRPISARFVPLNGGAPASIS